MPPRRVAPPLQLYSAREFGSQVVRVLLVLEVTMDHLDLLGRLDSKDLRESQVPQGNKVSEVDRVQR